VTYNEIKSRIVFEDNHLLIFNKPAGLLVQEDETGDPCILDVVKDFIKERDAKPGNVFLGLIHRIDRPVSGLVVLAKTGKCLERMTEAFKERKVKKIYHALVHGIPNPETGTLLHYHIKDGKRKIAVLSEKAKPGSKPAILQYKVLKTNNHISLLELRLQTGRFHQIRAQMLKNKTPIVGDLKYGAKQPNSDKSVCLHAYEIAFDHPTKETIVKAKAPYPKELQIWRTHTG